MNTPTPGKWDVASDSYGNVRHSKKACVFVSEGPKIAAQIANWNDALLIAASKEMYLALMGMNHMGGDDRGGYCICPLNNGNAPHAKHSTGCQIARYALAKALNRTYATGELLPDAFKDWPTAW